ncbi:MAG: helix-turn-helix transcriptional regulator [Ignavibacteriaceae bacterium]
MDISIYRGLPNVLRKYRKANGYKQSDVAQILGFTNSSRISSWEHGRAIPSIISVIRLSVLYKVLIDSLFIYHVEQARKEIYRRKRKLQKGEKKPSLKKNYTW